MRSRRLLLGVGVLLVITSCGGGGGGKDGDSAGPSKRGISAPTFAPDDRGATSSSSSTPSTTGGAGQSGSTTSSSAPKLEKVSFSDPIGDATRGMGTGRPPAWTDLAGGSLERQGIAYRLTVRLGGDAPERAPGPETMNIATFFDIDGDGVVEYELWVNLGANGWFPVWYDDKGNAIRGEASNVNVAVKGDAVQMLFPDVMIARPERLRFSTASEYGTIATLDSDAARRDEAPDNRKPVAFP